MTPTPKEPGAEARAEAERIVNDWNADHVEEDTTFDPDTEDPDTKRWYGHLEDAIATALDAKNAFIKLLEQAREADRQQVFSLRKERDTLKQQLERQDKLREMDREGFTRLANEKHEVEQQLEQAVRLACDFVDNRGGMDSLARVLMQTAEWLSSPAIAPIRERVKKGGAR